jgi:MFS family permease
MHPRFRLACAATTSDLALYLIMLSLPYRVMSLGASSAVLGMVPLAYAVPYSLTAATAGRFSDRWPRRGPIRAGLTVALAASAGLALVEGVPAILACVSLLGIGLGFFWPSIQAGMSEISAGANLARDTRLLNMGWSAGKGMGMLGGGLLLPWIGGEGLALVAGAAWLACFTLVPTMARPGSHHESVASDERRPGVQRQRAFLRTAWIANGLAYATAATLNHHLPKLLRETGIESERFGTFLGLVFLTQTLVFFVVGPRRSWHYRVLPLAAIQAVLVLATLAVVRPAGFTALLVLAPFFGLALGFLYQSSLYYSLHAPEGRGAQAGIHEATLGIFGAMVPLLGGFAVAGGGLAAPFVVAAGAALGGLLLGLFWLSRGGNQTAKASEDEPSQ